MTLRPFLDFSIGSSGLGTATGTINWDTTTTQWNDVLAGTSTGQHEGVWTNSTSGSPVTATFAAGTGTYTMSLVNAIVVGGFDVQSGNVTVSTGTGGSLALSGSSSFNVAASSSLTVSSAISGATFAVTKTGTGTLTLSGANTYSGGTAINAGTVNVGSSGALGSSGTISFGGGTLQYSASNTTDYSSRFSTAASQSYNIDTNGQNVTYATALTSSGATLAKSGVGTLTLSAANTFSGASTISGGSLKVDGSLAGAVTVASGGTLSGSGSVAGTTTLNSGGFISPANGSIGTLSLASLTFNGGGTLNMGLGSGNSADKIAITGAFTQGSAGTYTIDFGGTGAAGNTYTLATFGSTNFSSGGSFAFTNLASGVTGSFNLGLNDLTFTTMTAIPEPSTYAAILGIGALGFVIYRRRQARSAVAVTTEV